MFDGKNNLTFNLSVWAKTDATILKNLLQSDIIEILHLCIPFSPKNVLY